MKRRPTIIVIAAKAGIQCYTGIVDSGYPPAADSGMTGSGCRSGPGRANLCASHKVLLQDFYENSRRSKLRLSWKDMQVWEDIGHILVGSVGH